jgi:hypothetical protein
MTRTRSLDLGELVDRPTRRRAGVWRRALRRERERLRDRRRVAAMVLLMLTFGFIAAAILVRGEVAGADARAYWAGVRIWLNGGDPYNPEGPFLQYLYAPWTLPLFAPWALLPWDVAWFVWRGGTILLWLWTIDWAYRRRPLETAIVVAALGFSFAANLDLGNITLVLALLLFGAQLVGPRLAGLIWAVSASMKWIPAPLWLVLAPRARAWGLAWLAVGAVLTLATLPQTLTQLQTVLTIGPRPIRVDYLVLLWPLVPWLWKREEPFDWLRARFWRKRLAAWRAGASARVERWRGDGGVAGGAWRDTRGWLARFLGLAA